MEVDFNQLRANREQMEQANNSRFNIPVPGLGSPVGMGSAIAAGLQRAGVQPCSGCNRRKEFLDTYFTFNPIGWR